ncbi:MAG: PEP/pyruvate-binding domain-containing protein, partial [Halanaerobiales bacterium]
FVKFLNDVSQQDIHKVGGKAANLGEMIKTGLPVPEGFVLVVDSYKKFITVNKIDIKINQILKELDNNDFESIKKISNKIKKLFELNELPEDLIDEIDSSYEHIGSPEVVVRSSATMEDSPETSFAGQYDSFLNVKEKKQLHKYIKLCWASLWNARALSYRLKQNIGDDQLEHAVVVQKLIKAQKSGILFTANPVNNRRDQMLINSSWGLGEAIVSGNVTPDHWIVDRENHKIVEEEISIKEKMTVLNNNGTELVDLNGDKQEQPSLDQSEVLELIKLGQKTEDYFEQPQDIEWAYFDNEIYLVQSRPITTLFPELKPEDSDNKLKIYTNFLLIDKVMPEPLTPIGEDIWNEFLKKVLPTKWIKSAAGRLFVDTTELSRLERWWDKLRNNPSAMDPLTIETTLQVLEKNKAELKQQRKLLIKRIPTIFGMLNLPLLKFMITSMPKVIYGMLKSPEKVVNKAYKFGENQIESLKEKVKKLNTLEEKLEFIEEKAPAVYFYMPLKVLYYMVSSITYLDKARKIVSKYLDDISELSKVEKSLPHNITTEMGMDFLRTARKLDQSSEDPVPDHPEIKRLLNKYGHRGYLEVDPGVSRWKEEPEYVINLIKSYISNKSYNKRIEKFHHDKKEAEKTIQDITKRLKEKGAHRDARKVEKLLKRYRKLFGLRELPKYIMIKGVTIFRELLLDIGEELVAKGRLDRRQDISFVSFQDIISGEKLQQLVLQNREMYKKELKRGSVPRVMISTGETIYSPGERKKDNIFEGIPVSPGIHEGHVKVLESPEEGNKLNKGDILITKATNPAWTPLFLEIGGLITEMGGPMSHGSVVAREYGVPAIAGLREAMTRFKDGQLVRLNGETGKLEILKPQ